MYSVTETGSINNSALVCSCAGFWNNGSMCSHILAVYHLKGAVLISFFILHNWYDTWCAIGHINVHELVSGLMPVRKRGRPKNCSRALEREDDLDVLALRPGDWRKSPIRHVDYGMGFVVDYRIKPDTKRTVVWRVRFPDSPGGEQDSMSLKLNYKI